ncbi:TolB-like translocation protein [Candidatus Methanoperedens nitratireducens]|nr:hypothetical protein [Candidatus Methanoperedens nitroreducens]
MKSHLIILALIAIALISGCVQQGTTSGLPEIEDTNDRVISERLIVKFGFFSGIPENFKVSPDSDRVAYIANEGKKQSMVIDGEDNIRYDEIDLDVPVFSPDSKRTAYAAKEGGKWFVVVDGKEGKRYDSILKDRYTPVFSPDSQRVTYLAREGKELFVVADGKEEKHYDNILKYSPVFSPDSMRVAYGAEENGTWFVVVDGKEKQYGGSGRDILTFSSYSKHGGETNMAYKENEVNTGGGMLADKKDGYDSIIEGTLTFSPEGRHVVYGVFDGSRQFVVVDERRGKGYDSIIFTDKGGNIIFDSPDTFHYLALKDGGIYLVLMSTDLLG